MRLRKYAVTVMDNWTPSRLFWTLAGARRFAKKHEASNIYKGNYIHNYLLIYKGIIYLTPTRF